MFFSNTNIEQTLALNALESVQYLILYFYSTLSDIRCMKVSAILSTMWIRSNCIPNLGIYRFMWKQHQWCSDSSQIPQYSTVSYI